MATDVVQEQCEAEDNMSVQQRLMMGAATTIQGTGGALCEEGEGNQDIMITGGSYNNIIIMVAIQMSVIHNHAVH